MYITMPPAAVPPASAAACLTGTATEAVRDSGAAVLATPALVIRIFRDLESAADGESLRQVCQQAAASLDWFDLMWCARADLQMVQAAINHHASITVPAARVSRVVESSLSELWACPPLLKWVVLQAAKQGDAELLGVVLGKQQQQEQEGLLQPEGSPLLKREQEQQSQRKVPVTYDRTHNEKQLCKAFREHENTFWTKTYWKHAKTTFPEVEYPPVLAAIAHYSSTYAFTTDGCTIWLTVIAAEEAVRSGQVKLLEHMLQQGWFQQASSRSEAIPRRVALSEMLRLGGESTAKQQLGPAFLAAAAAGDVEAGKLLLNYCPELLDYALWTSPDHIRDSFIMLSVLLNVASGRPRLECPGPFLDVLHFVPQLHRAGWNGIRLPEQTFHGVLLHLCRHKHRHQPDLLQMLLDLGLVSCNQEVWYERSEEFWALEGYELKMDCPIIGVAVAEQNAAAVAVLVAAGAVLPEPAGRERHLWNLPFVYNDLQAVVSDLDDQVAAAGGGVIGAAQYQKAADVLRAYCEEHGREKIDASSVTQDYYSWAYVMDEEVPVELDDMYGQE
jgi:hypothetical protein